MPDKPEAAVVLVNFHSLADVEDRLRSDALAHQRVVLVDNASDPDEVTRLGREYRADVVLNPVNGGFAAGVNLAFRRLAEDRNELPVLLLNPDAAPSSDDLARLLAALADGGHDGVAPLLVEPDGRLQVGAAGARLSLVSVLVYFLFVSHLLTGWRGIFLTRRQSRRGGSVAWLCGGCLLLRADAVERFGAWPEDEIVYAEDVAWGTSASERGARFILVPDVLVPHEVGGSGGGSGWSGALRRLCRRRLGPVRGGLAAAGITVGIRLRRWLGRVVP